MYGGFLGEFTQACFDQDGLDPPINSSVLPR